MDELTDIYTTLPIDAHSDIRLLLLHPPKPGRGVECSLVVRRRKDVADQYYALSYTWGESDRHCNITINNFNNVKVTNNLFAALAHLRDAKHGGFRKFWVDALCINQADSTERSLQVQRMREVYSSADRVMVWLGDCNYLEGNAAATSLLRDEWFRQNLYQAVRETTPSWWERIWVWQEYAAARKPPIFCFGKVKIDSNEFKLLIQSLHQRTLDSKIQRLDVLHANAKTSPGRARTAVEHIASLKSCLHNLETLRAGIAKPLNLTFAEMLKQTANAEATDPRDRIFSLVGFLTPDTATLLKPDYTIPTGSVYAAATFAYMLEMGVIAAFSRVRLSLLRVDGLTKPSWAMTFDTHLDFAKYISETPFKCIMAGIVCPREQHQIFQFHKENNSVELCGWRFDTIRETIHHPSAELPPNYNDLFAKFMSTSKEARRSEAYIDEEDLRDTEDVYYERYQRELLKSTPGSNPYMTISPIEAAMRNPTYRSLLSPSSPEDHSRRIKRELKSVLQERRQWSAQSWADWNEEFTLRLTSIRNDLAACNINQIEVTTESFIKDLIARQAASEISIRAWSTRLNFGLNHHLEDRTICPTSFMRYIDAAAGRAEIFITNAGLVGIAPSSISQGDVITLLAGSNMPVILRPVDEHYSFQGLVYVHGIMNGEIAEVGVDASVKIELETFEIR